MFKMMGFLMVLLIFIGGIIFTYPMIKDLLDESNNERNNDDTQD